MARYERMSKEQLKGVVADYATFFPNWQPLQGIAFTRQKGPVRQIVWFEALRTGAYRPNCGISASVLPVVRMLPQMLDVRHRQATIKQHPSRRAEIATAMEKQFRPRISEPIDIVEILNLCKEEARDTPNDLAMLAILHAWLGEAEAARKCCSRVRLSPSSTPTGQSEEQIKAFCTQLADAIESGSAPTFLRSTVQEIKSN